jgi:hypothetical protein
MRGPTDGNMLLPVQVGLEGGVDYWRLPSIGVFPAFTIHVSFVWGGGVNTVWQTLGPVVCKVWQKQPSMDKKALGVLRSDPKSARKN